MSRKIPAKWRYQDLEFVIEQTRKELANGSDRFSLRRNIPANATSRTLSKPSEVDMLYSDRYFACGNEQIEAEYAEEIHHIEHLLHVNKVPLKLTEPDTDEWQKVEQAIRYRSIAMTLWDLYAIPWRFRGDKVFVINQPRDTQGSPVIRELTKKFFVDEHLSRLADAENEISKLEDRVGYWQVALTCLVLLVIFYLLGTWGFG